MGKYNTSKQIGTFAEFCKSKQKKSIKENSEVSIEVPFWDAAIQLLLDKTRGSVILHIGDETINNLQMEVL